MRRTTGLLGAVLALAAGVASADDARFAERSYGPDPLPALPGPAVEGAPGRDDPAAESAGCVGCHTAIGEEWERSLHRQAWADPVFQEAYTIEPLAFCRSCHAPEADPAAEPSVSAGHAGVGCTTCHGGLDAVRAPRASGLAAHAVVADGRLAGTAACASCHEFVFPGTREPMQSTISEHARSSAAGTPCQGCHMPEVEGPDGRRHASHDFAAARDPALLRRAAEVTASRSGPRGVTVAIVATGVGHAFPTGDMFRRLEVRATTLGATPVAAPVVHLGRVFGDRASDGESSAGFHRTQLRDARVAPPGTAGPSRASLRFPHGVASERVRWQVVYQRMPDAMAASLGAGDPIDEVVVAEGILEPEATTQAAGTTGEGAGR